MGQITGGCLCGKIRYTATADPVFQGVCHCGDCQRQTGTAFSVIIAFTPPTLTITGDMKTFEGVGETGGAVLRRFCPDCGSPIVSEPEAAPGLLFIKAGTLDDTSILDPKIHVWCNSKQPWLPLPEGAMSFPKSA